MNTVSGADALGRAPVLILRRLHPPPKPGVDIADDEPLQSPSAPVVLGERVREREQVLLPFRGHRTEDIERRLHDAGLSGPGRREPTSRCRPGCADERNPVRAALPSHHRRMTGNSESDRGVAAGRKRPERQAAQAVRIIKLWRTPLPDGRSRSKRGIGRELGVSESAVRRVLKRAELVEPEAGGRA